MRSVFSVLLAVEFSRLSSKMWIAWEQNWRGRGLELNANKQSYLVICQQVCCFKRQHCEVHHHTGKSHQQFKSNRGYCTFTASKHSRLHFKNTQKGCLALKWTSNRTLRSERSLDCQIILLVIISGQQKLWHCPGQTFLIKGTLLLFSQENVQGTLWSIPPSWFSCFSSADKSFLRLLIH